MSPSCPRCVLTDRVGDIGGWLGAHWLCVRCNLLFRGGDYEWHQYREACEVHKRFVADRDERLAEMEKNRT